MQEKTEAKPLPLKYDKGQVIFQFTPSENVKRANDKDMFAWDQN